MIKTKFRLTLFGFATIAIVFAVAAQAVQAQDDTPTLWLKAEALMKQSRMTEAVPILEKIIALDPKDAEAYIELGTALLGKAINEPNTAERKKVRIAARNSFIKAKELGKATNFVNAMIGSIPEDGSDGTPFSQVPRSHALTYAGEQAFTQGKIEEALDLYKQALEADPTNYHAALFSGDMYLKQNDYLNAEIWYQKAIAIDPNRETAYRYSATPLMRQRKFDEARARYIEAWITEPYSRFALNGLLQWGQATGTKLAHPRVDPPKTEVGADGKSKSTINIDPLADDGSMAWMAYLATKEIWRKEKFARAYPRESSYRSSLAEEAEALRDVVKMAKTLKAKSLSPQIQIIEKLDRDGLLEAFILLALPDAGIAQDHPAYVRNNREKLRAYVVKYVIEGNR